MSEPLIVDGSTKVLGEGAPAWVAEYARRVRQGSLRGMETFALQNASRDPLDVLAHVLSQGKLDFSGFSKLLADLAQAPSSESSVRHVRNMDAASMLSMARIVGSQRTSSSDVMTALRIYKLLLSAHGTQILKFPERLAFTELLALRRDIAGTDKYVRLLRIDGKDRWQSTLLRANARNGFGDRDRGWEVRAGGAWLDLVNRMYRKAGYEEVQLVPGRAAPFHRLLAAPWSYVDRGPLVTVVVPTFNGSHRVDSAMSSLLSQSWKNLQILVMDDASEHDSAAYLDAWARFDGRIEVVHLAENAGTYRARNVAVSEHARGDFITVHDDDDWSHPRKIELQVRHLMRNPDRVANMSLYSRVTGTMLFTRINNNPRFVQRNFSSLMLRRSDFERFGYWDVTNRGADGEFIDRILAVTGEKPETVGGAPMSYSMVSDESLTSGELSRGYVDSRRLWYQRAANAWHARTLGAGGSLKMPPDNRGERPFVAPMGMVGSRSAARTVEVDVLYATDFRFPGGNSSLSANEIDIMLDRGFRVGIMQIDSPVNGSTATLSGRVLDLAERIGCSVVSLRDDVSAGLVVLRHPTTMQMAPPVRSRVRTRRLVLIVNHPPYEVGGGGVVYDLHEVVDRAREIFGVEPEVAPESQLIHDALTEVGAGDLLGGSDRLWPGVVRWGSANPRTADPTRRPVIGRHGRDHSLKWPDEPEEILAAYPADGMFRVRILGGAGVVQERLGYEPVGWEVLPYGSMEAAEFLGSLDFFVYAPSPRLIESFGMAAAEAIASGLVTILPPYMRSTFGEAALYATAHEVAPLVSFVWNNPERYAAQSQAALAYAHDAFTDDAVLARLKRYGVEV